MDGEAKTGISTDDYRAAGNGKNGESSGIINIYNEITVYAYGGSGGSGGGNSSNGGGAGGYPAARDWSEVGARSVLEQLVVQVLEVILEAWQDGVR